ncbi:MAG: hypothetical protein Q3976_09735 [Corynebacterium sp.]|nr:hypothetical protein [Corynebacterium sp.]
MKTTIRRGLTLSVLTASALALSACSAGQITQTSDQVAAVDGASADSENNEIALRDVTVHMTADGATAGVKFTAVNQNPANEEHTLTRVTVNGSVADFDGNTTIPAQGSLVSDIPAEIEDLTKADDMHISYVANTVANDDFAFGGNQTVVFTFDNSFDIEVVATVSEPQPVSGTLDREAGEGDQEAH